MPETSNRSLKRAKNSVIKLADFVAESALSTVPGGTPAYKVAKILVSHAREFFSDRRDERIEEFHRHLLSEGDKSYWEDLKDREIPISEYYALLNSVVQDEEDKKIAFYAKVFRLILLEKIEPKYRTHVVRSVRELKASDFELMKQIYISEKYEQKGPGYRRRQVAALTNPDSPYEALLHTNAHSVRIPFRERWGGTSMANKATQKAC